ncbi:hypothetical protein M885DRAFT_578422 [Pelagophyceae sp. CCMP2097]|nr:hypothetical protein M885DRAFT_578422 [Pelagophyceae sp. CCMP2097]
MAAVALALHRASALAPAALARRGVILAPAGGAAALDALVAAVAASGLRPDVVKPEGLLASLAAGGVCSVFAGEYGSTSDLAECDAHVYRYKQAVGLYKLVSGGSAPQWFSPQDDQEANLERNGWNFLATDEDEGTVEWGTPAPLDAAPFTVTLEDGIAEAARLVRESGVALLRQAVPLALLEPCASAVSAGLEECRSELAEKRLQLNNFDKVDFAEIVHRSDGRYDIKVYDESISNLVAGAAWKPLLNELLGSDHVELYQSVIVANPGAKAQGLHCDNGHLFPGEAHLENPHCVVVIVPLIDVNVENGPTEFWPASQKEAAAKLLFLEAKTHFIPSQSSLALAADKGDVIVFDTRTVHRGMPNTSREPRAILYLAFARPWYSEGVRNFPEKRLFQ